MKIFIYFIIFISKITENALSTLRIIVVANGKKLLGALLQGLIALVWAFSTGLVVINVLEDPIKIIAFTLGSLIGSYIGSIIEEKIALGTNMLITITNKNTSLNIIKILNEKKYKTLILNGKSLNELKDILIIIVKRKKRKEIIKQIKKIDKKATIIIENATIFNNNYFNK